MTLGVPDPRHVEHFCDHRRVDSMLSDGVLSPRAGSPLPVRTDVGHGVALKVADAASFAGAR